jgi:flavorubredoxin
METRLTEIADGVHQMTTHVADMNFSFNQYLVAADEPLLFHTGPRQMFPLVSEAVSRVVPVDSLRWIAFGHVEADECGSMNEWLAAAPQSTVVQSVTGCMVSLTDLADRAPRPLGDGEVLGIGGHDIRWIDTPHVPHAWEAGIVYDQTTRTLFCGDLFTQTGAYPAASDDDLIGPAIVAEDIFHASSLAPASGATLRRLAELDIDTLALMHGPAFSGDCRAALLDLADDFDKRIAAS